jgi:hypothetical protein
LSEKEDWLPQGEVNANARLMAAAPGLLASLRLCVKRLDEYPDAKDGIALEGARRAIAKAEGVEPDEKQQAEFDASHPKEHKCICPGCGNEHMTEVCP